MLIRPQQFVAEGYMQGLTLGKFYELYRRGHLPFTRRTGKSIWIDLVAFEKWRQGEEPAQQKAA